MQTPYMRREAPLYAESHSLDHVDDARREFVLASRLVTAVLLGVMLGVERRATRLNLGVRSVTLISLTSSMVWVMATAGESAGLFAPVLVGGPCVAVGGAGIVAGLCTYAATKVRRRSTRNAGGMSALVGLCLAMGGACGAGLSLLTVGCYLAAVGVLRGDQGRNLNSVQVRDSAGGGERSVRKAGCEIGRPMMDRVGNVMGESVDGSGSST